MAEDEYYDDGFAGYVPTAEDPGPAMLVATGLFCVLITAIVPCLVSLGRRYEKRSLALAAAKAEETAEEEVKTEVQIPEQKREQSVVEDGVSVTLSNYEHGAAVPSGGGSSNSLAQTRTYHTREPNYIKGLFDKVVMPPYPDDTDGSVVSGGIFKKARSTVSADPAKSEVSETPSYATHATTTIFDAPIGRGRTRGYARKRRNFNDKRRVVKDIQNEAEADGYITQDVVMTRVRADLPQAAPESSQLGASDHPGITPSEHAGMTASELAAGRPPSTIALRSEVSSGISRGRHRGSRHRGGTSVLSYASSRKRSGSPDPSVMSRLDDHVITPMDAADFHDPGKMRVTMAGDEELDLCCGKHAWWRPSMIRKGFDAIVDVAEWDREFKRIVSISIPLCLEGFFAGLFDTLELVIVGQYIGTDALAAYTIIDLTLGLPGEFFGGIYESVGVLCSQAYGAENDFLVGQYAQIGSILYLLCIIPTIIISLLLVEDIVRLFGFDETVVTIAKEYSPYFLLELAVDGVSSCYHEMLTITGHERYCVFVGILQSALSVGILFALGASYDEDDFSLKEFGIVGLVISIFFMCMSIAFTLWKGWVEPFSRGLFRTLAMTNKKAVRATIKTALPLSFGYLLQYGEWEILTVFTAFMGPAEVAAWGVLGTLWEAFESVTEGVADGGEIRVSYHLGAGNPRMAKKASYKAILFGVFVGCFFTSMIFILGEDLAVWFTSDVMLQRMIADLLPYLGIGNITMTAGIVAWGLVGAQGRYRLATTVAFISSWLITLPVAAIFTYALNFDLKALTSAVVIGYAVTNTVLVYVLIRSDWVRLSKIVMELHALDDDSETPLIGEEGEAPAGISA